MDHDVKISSEIMAHLDQQVSLLLPIYAPFAVTFTSRLASGHNYTQSYTLATREHNSKL